MALLDQSKSAREILPESLRFFSFSQMCIPCVRLSFILCPHFQDCVNFPCFSTSLRKSSPLIVLKNGSASSPATLPVEPVHSPYNVSGFMSLRIHPNPIPKCLLFVEPLFAHAQILQEKATESDLVEDTLDLMFSYKAPFLSCSSTSSSVR